MKAEKLKILLVGSGGREMTFAWKIAQSPYFETLYFAPGNAGVDGLNDNRIMNVDLDIKDFDKLKKFCVIYDVDIVIVGPEDPLVNGIKDAFAAGHETEHIYVCGPSRRASMLEASKDYAKEFMDLYSIPTAPHKSFTDFETAAAYVETLPDTEPIVVKKDWLDGGKGVTICNGKGNARATLDTIFLGKTAGTGKVLVEKFLKGIEFSIFAMTDGKTYKLLSAAKDYKREGDGDTGRNTGGMGAVTNLPFLTAQVMEKVHNIVNRTIVGMAQEKNPYTGFLYCGLMLAEDGEVYVIEYNCRMGDPETQVVFSKLKSDLLQHIIAMQEGRLAEEEVEEYEDAFVGAVLCAENYPSDPKKGDEIEVPRTPNSDVRVILAGVKKDTGALYSNGGRLLMVIARGRDVDEAQGKLYPYIATITCRGSFYRTDIGNDVRDWKQPAAQS